MNTRITENQQKTTLYKSIFTGTTLSFVEVYVTHPFWVIKTRKMCDYKFSLNPRVLYRGAAAEALIMAPVDIIQIGTSTFLNERFFNNSNNSSLVQRFTSGFLGGAIGGQFISPVESVMTLQQKYKCTFVDVLKRKLQEGNLRNLFIGGAGTSLRNGIYNCGFFVTPLVSKNINGYIKNENKSSIMAGFMAGLIVAPISHPFDTIKTIQQKSEKSKTFNSVFKEIYKEEGIKGFFKGLVARSTRVVIGISAMSFTYEKIENRQILNR
jgi:hypothetical protein